LAITNKTGCFLCLHESRYFRMANR